MRWKWCEMCRFDKLCENQDRNIECACYAREQTLRAEQYANLIDKQQNEIKKLKKQFNKAIDGLELIANYGVSAWDIANTKWCLKQIKDMEK